MFYPKCLVEEFSSIYVFHLRGNQRTAGELSRKEGGKVFGSGSRAPIAITLLIKNPKATHRGQIYFHDIGDYLSREQKLEAISGFGSIAGITAADGWQHIAPDEHGDWLKQRDDSFSDFIVLGDKKEDGARLFDNYSRGLESGRDPWCFNFSSAVVKRSMSTMIDFYNSEVDRFDAFLPEGDRQARTQRVDDFADNDGAKISWTSSLKQELVRGRKFFFQEDKLCHAVYRPFAKQWAYYSSDFLHRVGQMPRIFPDAAAKNRVIVVKQRWPGNGQLALMVDRVVELQSDGGTQCFPLYLYEEVDAPQQDDEGRPSGAKDQATLFPENSSDLFEAAASQPDKPRYTRRDAITDEGLAHFQVAYPGETISKEDVFYYVYGLLHSPDYRERYADNLGKELPRIPCVKSAEDFRAFSQAGRDLAELHLNYETVAMYPATIESGATPLSPADYRVEKMRYGKKGKDKDLSTVHYNARITVSGIPLEAYEYVVNGKPAIDWVMERQCVKTDKASGIVNDANAWAVETMNNPRYPLELLLRVVTVSVETMKIVETLPRLDV